MTKVDAIILMHQGKKLTHRWFSSDEWVTILDGEYVFEDGCRCTPDQFWRDRDFPTWRVDWRLFNG